MKAADFRRIALSLEGAEEGSHMGQADFRVGGRIFATLAAEKQGYGNLMLTPEQQAAFVAEQPGCVSSHCRRLGQERRDPCPPGRRRTKTCSPAHCAPHGNCGSRRTKSQEQERAGRQCEQKRQTPAAVRASYNRVNRTLPL